MVLIYDTKTQKHQRKHQKCLVKFGVVEILWHNLFKNQCYLA
jgi:hypothetical protein